MASTTEGYWTPSVKPFDLPPWLDWVCMDTLLNYEFLGAEIYTMPSSQPALPRDRNDLMGVWPYEVSSDTLLIPSGLSSRWSRSTVSWSLNFCSQPFLQPSSFLILSLSAMYSVIPSLSPLSLCLILLIILVSQPWQPLENTPHSLVAPRTFCAEPKINMFSLTLGGIAHREREMNIYSVLHVLGTLQWQVWNNPYSILNEIGLSVFHIREHGGLER